MMKRFRIYVWLAAFFFAANAWLSYVLPSAKISSGQLPIWQNILTRIAVFSQLPSLPISKVIAEYFDLSYPGLAITTSIVSVIIYIPLIHLFRPWRPGVRMHSLTRKLTAFSSSLNPCVRARQAGEKADTFIGPVKPSSRRQIVI